MKLCFSCLGFRARNHVTSTSFRREKEGWRNSRFNKGEKDRRVASGCEDFSRRTPDISYVDDAVNAEEPSVDVGASVEKMFHRKHRGRLQTVRAAPERSTGRATEKQISRGPFHAQHMYRVCFASIPRNCGLTLEPPTVNTKLFLPKPMKMTGLKNT